MPVLHKDLRLRIVWLFDYNDRSLPPDCWVARYFVGNILGSNQPIKPANTTSPYIPPLSQPPVFIQRDLVPYTGAPLYPQLDDCRYLVAS